MLDFRQEEWEWSKQDLFEDLFLKFAKIEEVFFSFATGTEALEIPPFRSYAPALKHCY